MISLIFSSITKYNFCLLIICFLGFNAFHIQQNYSCNQDKYLPLDMSTTSSAVRLFYMCLILFKIALTIHHKNTSKHPFIQTISISNWDEYSKL